MVYPVLSYMLSPFEGKTNPGYPQRIKLYLQETEDTEKEYDKLDISVSNSKDIIDNFLSLTNKFGWVRLAFMVENGTVAKNIFSQVYQIKIVDMHHQAHGYFVLISIGIIGNSILPKPLVVSYLQNLASSANQVHNFYDKARSDMTAKEIEGSIKSKSLKKLRIHQGEYECNHNGGIIRNDGPTMICILLKSSTRRQRLAFLT